MIEDVRFIPNDDGNATKKKVCELLSQISNNPNEPDKLKGHPMPKTPADKIVGPLETVDQIL